MMKVFRSWNWEGDYGEDELQSEPAASESCALVYLDDRLLPYRVVTRNPSDLIRPIDNSEIESFTYDYVYADDETLIEKRSLDEDGNVFLIVRYVRASDGSVSENAWYAQSKG